MDSFEDLLGPQLLAKAVVSPKQVSRFVEGKWVDRRSEGGGYSCQRDAFEPTGGWLRWAAGAQPAVRWPLQAQSADDRPLAPSRGLPSLAFKVCVLVRSSSRVMFQRHSWTSPQPTPMRATSTAGVAGRVRARGPGRAVRSAAIPRDARRRRVRLRGVPAAAGQLGAGVQSREPHAGGQWHVRAGARALKPVALVAAGSCCAPRRQFAARARGSGMQSQQQQRVVYGVRGMVGKTPNCAHQTCLDWVGAGQEE
mgnify:CR=1 FL=1